MSCYKVTKNKGEIKVTNTSDKALKFSLYKDYPNEFIGSQSLSSELREHVFNIEDKDCKHCNKDREGMYRLEVEYLEFDKKEIIYIPYYPSLVTSIVEDVERVLCGCECENCDDCQEDEEKNLLNTLLKVMFYYTLVSKAYCKYLTKASDCFIDLLNENTKCLLLNESVFLNLDNKILLKRTIAHYYLSFIYAELRLAEDKTYIYKLFNFDIIKKCIDRLGLNIQCILDKIDEIECYSEVGNTVDIVENRSSLVITEAHFKTKSFPKYFSSGCEDFTEIRIDKLNLYEGSSLKLDGVDVVVGMIIPMEIIRMNKLVYQSSDTHTNIVSDFDWSYKDPCTNEWKSINNKYIK